MAAHEEKDKEVNSDLLPSAGRSIYVPLRFSIFHCEAKGTLNLEILSWKDLTIWEG